MNNQNTNKPNEEIKQQEDRFLEGFSITGEYISKLTDKTFTIVSVPNYEVLKSIDKENELVKKLHLVIKLADGSIMDYYPNKLSQRKIMNEAGMKLSDWEGVTGEFEVLEQMVGQQKKKVIYVKSATMPKRPTPVTK